MKRFLTKWTIHHPNSSKIAFRKQTKCPRDHCKAKGEHVQIFTIVPWLQNLGWLLRTGRNPRNPEDCARDKNLMEICLVVVYEKLSREQLKQNWTMAGRMKLSDKTASQCVCGRTSYFVWVCNISPSPCQNDTSDILHTLLSCSFLSLFAHTQFYGLEHFMR